MTSIAVIGARRRRRGSTGVALVTAADLVTALGGNASVPAIYDTRNNVEQTVDLGGGTYACGKWDDARGAAGFGPSLLQATAVNRPVYTLATQILTFDGTNDVLTSAADALFDLSGAYTVVLVGSPSVAASKYAIQIAGASRYLAISTDATGKLSAEAQQTGFPQAISTVAGSATRRCIIASKNATTDVSVDIPNTTRVSAVAGAAQAAGTNTMNVGALNGATSATAMVCRAVVCLNRQATAGDITTIMTWAVNNHAAVAA